MKFSLDWLRDFIDFTEKDLKKVREVMTTHSAEIETIEEQGALLKNVLLAEVKKLEPHPNADKLKLATVNFGKGKIRVVCGGSNLKEGMKIAFAPVGTVVQLGGARPEQGRGEGGQMVALQKVAIRGVESAGMICASTEIWLGEMFPIKQPKEIVDLSHLKAPLGTTLDKALGLDDIVIHIDNSALTHRGDLFSHRGIAREFVANRLAKNKEKKEFQIPENHSPAPVSITIHDKKSCPRYMGVYLTEISVTESPTWMKKRLIALGIRPISNIVDITNYVMLELGMPTHAYDLDQVQGKEWTIRKGKTNEELIVLDEKNIKGNEELLVIHDGVELIDLCGIRGGYRSGINSKTNRVWLHAPVYHPTLVRRSAKASKQNTDAGIIYEKGVDNHLAETALARCVELILELSPSARVASKVLDIKNYEEKKSRVTLRYTQLKRLLGINVPKKETERILNNLGFETKKNKTGLTVTIPTWRQKDVTMEADMIEEVGRIYGYSNIEAVLPTITSQPHPLDPNRLLQKEVKQFLCAQEFNELCTFAFLGAELLKKSGMKADDHTIELENPLSADMSLMRQSLLPRTLETIAQNLRYKESFRVFEMTRTHFKKEEGVEEPLALIIATVGEDLRQLQGVVQKLFEEIGYKKVEFKNAHTAATHQHPGRTAEVLVQGKTIGKLYGLHPKIAQQFDIKKTVVLFEYGSHTTTEVNPLTQMPRTIKKYSELDRFPPVILDISLLIPKKSAARDYEKIIAVTDRQLIKKIELKDEYKGEGLSEGKRSITYSITYRLPDRTLTEAEVNAVHQKVLDNLKKTGATIR